MARIQFTVAHDREADLRIDRHALPAWPLALPFAGYGVGWLLGLGDMIWLVAAGVLLALLVRTRDVRLPPGFGIWLMFLCWMLASVITIDTTGRAIGFAYRAALYVAATVIAVYAYNAVKSVQVRYVAGMMVLFLLVMTLFGFWALAFPLLTVRTPMALVLPEALQSNELVRDMAIRRLTQFNPDSWEQTVPRPSAPFLYANTWGNVYPLVVPLATMYAWQWRRTWRGMGAATVVLLSLVPAFMTLNRGLFVGLGVFVVYAVLHRLRSGRFGAAGGLASLGLVIAAGTAMSPVGALLSERLESGSSTDNRQELYWSTIREVLDSPLLGFGAPRPAEYPWLPSLGTQGQLWTILFSHGVIATLLFISWFVFAAFVSWRRTGIVSAVLGGLTAATLVQTVFYGMMTGLNLSLLFSVLAFRPKWIIPASEVEAEPADTSQRLALAHEPGVEASGELR